MFVCWVKDIWPKHNSTCNVCTLDKNILTYHHTKGVCIHTVAFYLGRTILHRLYSLLWTDLYWQKNKCKFNKTKQFKTCIKQFTCKFTLVPVDILLYFKKTFNVFRIFDNLRTLLINVCLSNFYCVVFSTNLLHQYPHTQCVQEFLPYCLTSVLYTRVQFRFGVS